MGSEGELLDTLLLALQCQVCQECLAPATLVPTTEYKDHPERPPLRHV